MIGVMKITVGLVFVLLLVPSADAKGSAERIIVTGPGLKAPLEITDAKTLALFSPYGEKFFAIPEKLAPSATFEQRHTLEEPSRTDGAYEVEFQWKTKGLFHTGFAFRYVPGNPGHIYLPDGKERPMNPGLIMRPGLDGHWLRSSAEFDQLMRLEFGGVIARGR